MILALGIGGEIRLNRRVIAYIIATERFAHVVHDGVDVLLVFREEFLESGAEVLRVGTSAGVVRVAFNAAGEDLLFEAVEALGYALEIECATECGSNGLLSGRGRGCQPNARPGSWERNVLTVHRYLGLR